MNKAIITASTLTDIANAIRSKLGVATTYKPSEMAAAIGSIEGGSSGISGFAYDMGTFTLDADHNGNGKSIPHNLGKRPGFVLVWTDDYIGVTNPDNISRTSLGFLWMDGIMGLENWLTSAASTTGITVNFDQSKASSGMNVSTPTSTAYVMNAERVTAESFALVRIGNTTYYRAGVTYHYFVCNAWWNVGGSPAYSVTNTLKNCTTSNSTTGVGTGGIYKATITANDGYELSSVVVTMGGENITSTAYSDGVITIATITGDIVITASAIATTT